MNKSKILFLTGIIAGTGAFVAFLTQLETAQYILGFISIAAFAISEKIESRRDGLKDTDIAE